MEQNLAKLKSAYASQKFSAAKRNIGWELTFDEWLDVWETSGHLANRGRGKEKHLMGRKGDTGPYSIDNIEIITAEESERQRVLNGKNTTGKNNGMYGRKGKLHPNSRPVLNLTTGEVFDSITQAGQRYNGVGNIYSACTGKLKTSGKCQWTFLDQHTTEE